MSICAPKVEVRCPSNGDRGHCGAPRWKRMGWTGYTNGWNGVGGLLPSLSYVFRSRRERPVSPQGGSLSPCPEAIPTIPAWALAAMKRALAAVLHVSTSVVACMVGYLSSSTAQEPQSWHTRTARRGRLVAPRSRRGPQLAPWCRRCAAWEIARATAGAAALFFDERHAPQRVTLLCLRNIDAGR